MKLQKTIYIIVSLVIGIAVGVGTYTFIYAKGSSYLSNDAAACANCHIMNDEYYGWTKSSHRSVAVCNDCHTPPGFVSKYMTKAENGYWHSYAFTTGDFHEPIQIKERNRTVTEQACRKCHLEVVDAIEGPHGKGEQIACLQCHSRVGHQ